MSAITVGFPEFKMRLDRIRRRLNLLALADAAGIAGSGLLFAASAVVAAAFWLSPQAFTWILRTSTALAATILVFAGWWLRTKWHDMYQTALHVDRSAGLESRVATMLAHPQAESRSPLRSVLLWQIFDHAQKWDVERVAPVRVGRPLITFVIALATFAITTLLVPENAPPAESSAGGISALSVANTSGLRAGDQARHGSGAQLEQGTRGNTTAAHTRARKGDDRSRGGIPPGPNSARGAAVKNPPAGDKPDQGQTQKQPHDLDTGKHPAPKVGPSDVLKNTAAPPPGQQLPKAEAPDRRKRPATKNSDNNQPRRPNQTTQPRRRTGGSKATGGKPRKGKAGGTRGLLAEKAVHPIPGGKNAQPMVIQLKAFAARPLEQSEPQGRPEGTDKDGQTQPIAQPVPIASGQSTDSSLRRSVITQAHQHLIRELFTPNE